jgi:probable F420-dependent oxidoreductase
MQVEVQMKFGINILNFGPGASPRSLQRWAEFAQEVGFHLIMISDHVAITPDVQTEYPAPFYDPFVSLSWIASFASEVEIGTTVTILPYRHPLLTARMAANLDQLSGGHFILGVGVGWAKQEFDALGVPFNRRGAIMDEYLDAIKICWANDVATYDGRFVAFRDVNTGPRALRPQGPPVWVGGSSEAALRRAVRYGDAWHPYRVRVDWLKEEALPRLRAIAEVEEKPVPALCPRITLRLTDSPLPEHQRVAGQGTIDQVRADLEALESLGAEYVLLDTYTGKPAQTLHPENDWAMLRELAERALDLERKTIREA